METTNFVINGTINIRKTEENDYKVLFTGRFEGKAQELQHTMHSNKIFSGGAAEVLFGKHSNREYYDKLIKQAMTLGDRAELFLTMKLASVYNNGIVSFEIMEDLYYDKLDGLM